MKKIWFGFAALLLSSSIYGYETDIQNETGTEQTVVSTENAPSLTPKRFKSPLILAQEPPRPDVSQVSAAVPITEIPQVPAMPAAVPPAPTYHYEAPRIAMATPAAAPAAAPETDAFVYAELERLAGEVQKLQKDTAKPNTKKAFSTPKLSGIAFFDFYSIDQPNGSSANYQNQGGIRELRLGASGNGYDSFDYKAEIGINPTGGRVNVYDTWIGAKNVPLFGYLRAGHYRVETGLGAMTGSTQTTLQEYTAPAATFAISRRLGVSSEHLFANDRIRLFYGLFQGSAINTDPHYMRHDDQGPIFNTRLTIAPYFAEKGRYVLHVGGHYSYVAGNYSNINTTTESPAGISYQSYGNSWLFSTATLATGNTTSDHHHRGGLELAYQSGPFAARSEAFFARYGAADDDRTATGASLELTYFLTGEHRDYNLATGTFGAATVKRPFHPFKCGDWNLVDGMGAWQFVTQYAYVDLEDWRGLAGATGTYVQGDRGGRQHDLTFGLNWFWTSNIRWIFSYTHSQQNVGSDHHYDYQDILGTSLRVYF